MTLDPQAQALLDAARSAGLEPVYLLPIEEARTRMEDAFRNPDPPEELESVQDTVIPGPGQGLGLRVYKPTTGSDLPCLVFIHGGGWTLNSLNTHDAICRRLANVGRCVVLSVDHRRAPEYKYPAALEDAYTALQWAFHNGGTHGWDSTRIAVGGDSSGGTLATTAALLNRDRGGPLISCQLLIYPVTDYYLPGTVAYSEMATGYLLNRDFMIWLWHNYLPSDPKLTDPYLCPLRAPDLTNMPRTLIVTAHYDPVRDEGRAYAEKLEAAGNQVELWHYDDQMHGFIMLTNAIDRARRALDDIGEHLRKVLGET